MYFQIFINPLNCDSLVLNRLDKASDLYVGEIEGGRLIHTLPVSFRESTQGFHGKQKLAYQSAFQADIVNLLAGPLAEASYVYFRGNELINPQLVGLQAHNFYGGASDLGLVQEYKECFIDNQELREIKLNALFLEAFRLVNEKRNWCEINALADSFLTTNAQNLCNEVIAVIDRTLKIENRASHCRALAQTGA